MGEHLDRLVYEADQMDSARRWIEAYPTRREPSGEQRTDLAGVKASAVERGDQDLASAAWCLEQIAAAQEFYLMAFSQCRQRQFYAAWCELERGEVRLSWLRRHFLDPRHSLGVEILCDRITRMQALFPYRVFLSPGLLVKRMRCSICGEIIRLRRSCGHRRFSLYDGEMCGRILEDVEPLEVSLVERPVQKYSVAFPQGLGSYNYALVDYLVRALETPWSEWSVEIQKRRRVLPEYDTPAYRKLGRNERCACGSGLKFKKCCLDKMREEHEHYQFSFGGTVPAALLSYIDRPFIGGLDEPSAEAAGIVRDDAM